jgi:hypothetical protein
LSISLTLYYGGWGQLGFKNVWTCGYDCSYEQIMKIEEIGKEVFLVRIKAV